MAERPFWGVCFLSWALWLEGCNRDRFQWRSHLMSTEEWKQENIFFSIFPLLLLQWRTFFFSKASVIYWWYHLKGLFQHVWLVSQCVKLHYCLILRNWHNQPNLQPSWPWSVTAINPEARCFTSKNSMSHWRLRWWLALVSNKVFIN